MIGLEPKTFESDTHAPVTMVVRGVDGGRMEVVLREKNVGDDVGVEIAITLGQFETNLLADCARYWGSRRDSNDAK